MEGLGGDLGGWETVVAAVAVLVVISLCVSRASRRRRQRRPPGPRGWPVLGSLPLLGTLPHQSFYKLSKKYGPLMYMHLGSVSTLVVTSPKMAEAILKSNDVIMASRRSQMVGKILSYDSVDMALSPYGPHWRYLRKVSMAGFLSPSRVRQFQDVRERQALDCLHFILEEAERGNTVNIVDCMSVATVNSTTEMMMNKSYCSQKLDSKPGSRTMSNSFRETYQEMFELLGAFNIADYVPWLKPFDPQGFSKPTKDMFQKLDGFWDMIIEEHRQRLLMGPPENYKEDFVDFLLGLGQAQEFQQRLSAESIKALLHNLLAAASDSASVTTQWAFAEIMRRPQISRRVQDELDSVVGRRLVREEDLSELRYLDAVIKETLRLHPPGPLMIPHESTQDCEIEGFHIPARTQVFVNLWGIHRDPAFWENPLVFDPDRFLNGSFDFNGQNFSFIPFGSGRRMCPGTNFGAQMLTYFMAVLLHSLDWTLPKGQEPEDLDMEETFGMVVSKKVPLAVFGKARLPAHVIYPTTDSSFSG